MLDAKSLQIVKATAPAVMAHAETITRRFYQRMFEGNPEVLNYFNPAHQRTGAQQGALAGAICAYAANIENLGALGSAVELIAQKHCSLGIQPEHYPIVGHHLLLAVKEVLGDAVTDDVAAAWGAAYQQLAEIFIQREGEIYQAQAAAPGGWTGFRRFRVERKSPESELVTSFYLMPEDGQPLPLFQAGQYVTVKIEWPGQVPALRNYSLSDRPGAEYFRISVKRETGLTDEIPTGVASNALHDSIHVGDVVELGPPCGEFVLPQSRPADRPIVFLAGGVGITPLLSMAKHLIHHSPETPITFIQAARNRRVHAFGQELKAIAESSRAMQLHIRYAEAEPGDLENGHCHSTGRICGEWLTDWIPSGDADYFLCGPTQFMSQLAHELQNRLGIAADRIRHEFFGPRQELVAPVPITSAS